MAFSVSVDPSLNSEATTPSPTPRPTISIVIPTLNEARNIGRVLESLPPVDEILIVDGHSVDGTVEAAREVRPDIRVVNQTRRGKGNALVCGFVAASCDVVVAMDADGSTNPDDIERFVDALIDGADFATGTRFVTGAGSDDITRVRRLGSDFLTGSANLLFRTKYTDINFGYNAFWRRHLPVLALPSPDLPETGKTKRLGDGFEIEAMLNVRAAKAKLRVVEVAAFELPREFGESNLHSVRDGLRILRGIVSSRFRNRSTGRNPVATVEPPLHLVRGA